MIPDDELTAIEARANAATAGPWQAYDERLPIGAGVVGANDVDVCSTGITAQSSANREFIASARADVPKLVAEVRALRAERDALRAALDDFATHGTRADLNPTMRVLPQTDGERRIVEWFYKYLRQLDAFVKTSATSVLIKAGARP